MHIGLFGSDQSFALRYILYIFTNLLNWSHIVRLLLSRVTKHFNVSGPPNTISPVHSTSAKPYVSHQWKPLER
jgi:hypothetical protein